MAMKNERYFERARDLYESGDIDGSVYDAIALNAEQFCDDEEEMQPWRAVSSHIFLQLKLPDKKGEQIWQQKK